MTLVLESDFDIVKMYVCTKNEVPYFSSSKVPVWKDTQTEFSETETDSIEIITYLHKQMVKMANFLLGRKFPTFLFVKHTWPKQTFTRGGFGENVFVRFCLT